MRIKSKYGGFSLIEVNLAILIAAGGLVSLFALFPIGLRQSVMSQADLHQASFANSFFEAVSANVRLIDDLRVWNDVNAFWAAAVEGTGVAGSLLDPQTLKNRASDATGELIEEDLNDPARALRFLLREENEADSSFAGTQLKLPPQLVVRVRPIRQTDLDGNQLPNRYVISLVSTHEPAPAIFSHNTVYSVEYYFQRRP